MQPPLSLFTESASRTLVILTQVYVPDSASVGQHMHDVAVERVKRGDRVIVFTADCGYEDTSRRFARYEWLDGVHILRLPLSNFGKASLTTRLIGGGSFLAQATSLALGLRRIDHVLVSTSPPMCGLGGVAISRARGVPLTYWIMDLNPDQIVATGRFRPDAAPVRAFDWINRQVLARARRVVVLDRYMRDRVVQRYGYAEKLIVLPPWPHVDVQPPIAHADNAFRRAHGLSDRRVVMYSGNLSPVHPISTVIDAARRLATDPRLRFVFVGGGLGRAEIERVRRERGADNIMTLPYQPLHALRESLSAADVHLVAMGDAMVGIVHPCKVYGAMAVGRPLLAVAPERSHIGDLVAADRIGWRAAHGDVEAVVNALHELLALDARSLERMGERAQALIGARFQQGALRGQFCDLLA